VSASSPQSYVSPDGNYYWDGLKWVPMQQPARAEAAAIERGAWRAADTTQSTDPNEPITIGSRSPDGQWWWDGTRWQHVNAPISGSQLRPSPFVGAVSVGGAAGTVAATAVAAGFAWRQQLGGAAAWSIGFGLVSIVVPFAANFYFPIMPLFGFINAVRAIQRGRLIGGIAGIVLNALGGLVTLFASGLIGG